MSRFQKLPSAEFEIMQVVWEHKPPVTTSMVVAALKEKKSWSVQTVGSLMMRLLERGFLRAEKPGKDRLYYPIVGRDEYLRFETDAFVRQYHGNSLISLVNALSHDPSLSKQYLEELLNKLQRREK